MQILREVQDFSESKFLQTAEIIENKINVNFMQSFSQCIVFRTQTVIHEITYLIIYNI